MHDIILGGLEWTEWATTTFRGGGVKWKTAQTVRIVCSVCSVCHIHVTYRKKENVVYEIFVDAAAGQEDLPESKLYILDIIYIWQATRVRRPKHTAQTHVKRKDMTLGDARCSRGEYKWVY